MTDIDTDNLPPTVKAALHCPLRADCPLKGKNILLVEDDPGCTHYIQELLGQPCQECDLHVLHSRSVENATELLRKEGDGVHAIVLDLSLPDSFGLETFRKLAEEFQQPIIIFTGSDDPNLWREAVRAGASDFIVKGHNSGARIFASVRSVLESRGYATEVTQLTDRLAIIQTMHETLGTEIGTLAHINRRTNTILLWTLLAVALAVMVAIYVAK